MTRITELETDNEALREKVRALELAAARQQAQTRMLQAELHNLRSTISLRIPVVLWENVFSSGLLEAADFFVARVACKAWRLACERRWRAIRGPCHTQTAPPHTQ